MKRLLILILLIVSFACWGANDSRITQIRREYKNIDRHVKDLSHRTYDFDWTDAGTEVEIFKDNYGTIKLIKAGYYVESAKTYMRYYFKDKSLIFAFMEYWRYTIDTVSPGYSLAGVKPTHDYFYFSNNKLILWKGDQKNDTMCCWRLRSDTTMPSEILSDVNMILDSTYSR